MDVRRRLRALGGCIWILASVLVSLAGAEPSAGARLRTANGPSLPRTLVAHLAQSIGLAAHDGHDSAAFARTLRVRRLDLSTDRRPPDHAYYVIEPSGDFCGSAGCTLYVYEQRGDRSWLLYVSDVLGTVNTITVMGTARDGMKDLCAQKSAADGEGQFYRAEWNEASHGYVGTAVSVPCRSTGGAAR